MTPEALDRITSTPRDHDGDVCAKLCARMERARGLPQLALVAEDVRLAQEWGAVADADRPRLTEAYRAARTRLARAQTTEKEAAP